MQANKRTLDNIFSPSIRFIAPLFQRPYVWNRDHNWLPLWESIRDVAERLHNRGGGHPHFLGAVVLNHLAGATGDVQAREIIDGQQRLTTLQILIAVLRDIATEYNLGKYSKLFDRWIDNLLVDDTKPDDAFKVWPTNADREHFARIMRAGSPFAVYHAYRPGPPPTSTPTGFGPNDDPTVRSYLLRRAGLTQEERDPLYESLRPDQRKEADQHLTLIKNLNVLIPNAYFYFYAVILEWLGDPHDSAFKDRMQLLYQTLNQDLVLVIIDLDDKDDAQQIFETMNALGTPLLPADLVKNFLFRAADQQNLNVNQIYITYWQIFDDHKHGWRDKVRQGRLTRPRVDLFLQHYLTLITGDDILVTDLFSAYRKWAIGQKQPADALVAHFRRYADIYWQFEHAPADSREALFFARMAQLDTTTVFPLMLEVFSRHTAPGDEQAIRAIMVDLESFLVRRAVCGFTSKNYNRLFRTLVQQLQRADDFSPATIRQFLLKQTADAANWPDDAEFRTHWMERKLYTAQIQQRTRMLLEALERQLHTSKTNAHAITGTITIEHLMPQKWETHWPLPADHNTETARLQRNTLIQTIGNLTIVSKALNPSLSNGPWSAKRPVIQVNNGLILNLTLPQTWDEQSILQRSAQLFDTAVAIWPYPGQSSATG